MDARRVLTAATDGRPPRVLFSGSRSWRGVEAVDLVLQRLERLPDESLVIHGAAPQGLDAIVAGAFDRRTGVRRIRRRLYCAAIPALWNGPRGRGAGHARNAVMIGLLDPLHDWCEFFRAEGESPGTDGCMEAAVRAGIAHNVHRWDGSHQSINPFTPLQLS